MNADFFLKSDDSIEESSNSVSTNKEFSCIKVKNVIQECKYKKLKKDSFKFENSSIESHVHFNTQQMAHLLIDTR